jgi:hypothetical protein
MENISHKKILIIADIEGSSGCLDYEASSFMGRGWPRACLEMSLDINAVVAALFDAGVQHVFVKDFHRTGYNLFPHYIDPRATLWFRAMPWGLFREWEIPRMQAISSWWGCTPPPGPGDFCPIH